MFKKSRLGLCFPFPFSVFLGSYSAFKFNLIELVRVSFFPHRKLRKLASPVLCAQTCQNNPVPWKITKIDTTRRLLISKMVNDLVVFAFQHEAEEKETGRQQ